ncbi:MAG TPA: alpha/beta hydrolase [Anaerolineales bacterium]|nr:alpha/beta hydrolase [Anaerolineales bacterium]
MKKQLRWLITLGLFCLLSAGMGYTLNLSKAQAHAFVTHPPAEREAYEKSPSDFNLPAEALTLTTSDGLHLAAWYVPSQNGAAVIAQHGYQSDRSEMLEEATILAEAGFGVLVMDLRTHGQSDGEYITFGVAEMADMQAAWDYLLTRPDVQPTRIGLLGNSMGGSIVLQYAAQNPDVQAVMADSAFSSIDDTIAVSVKHFTGLPAFPFATLITYFAEQETGIDSNAIAATRLIANISPRPVFLLQGGADTVVSAESGAKLFAAALQPKELWYDANLGHVEFQQTYPQEYAKRTIAFFRTHLLK